ncbi:hypothetical protein [Nocardia transvalensis]|uniref:hypothetical protein n=1 Tax=Nocardia transvalensis TaxID=37333 RepID=UPI0018951B66|nr:hypothetical protein [Nocardia transvalensis]MBF6332147.1 hypothetical protein [Nocardia transvalensis]
MTQQTQVTRSAIRLGLVASIAIGVVAATASPAAAAGVEFPPVYTVGNGQLGCVGTVTATVRPGPDEYVPANEARVYLRGTFYGPEAPSGSPLCFIGGIVRWHNLDTGTSGDSIPAIVSSVVGRPSTDDASVTINTGSGRIRATLTTNAIHIPTTVEFTVP